MERRRTRHVLLAVVFLIAFSPTGSSMAAQLETLPSQQIPEAAKTPSHILRQPGGTPGAPWQLPGSQHNMREIPLPEVFRGCWSGSVPRLDSMKPLSPKVGRLIW